MRNVLSLFFFCLVATARGDLTNGLLAYYPFNGNANDEAGNGFHGTVVGATLTKDRLGNANSAYNFNGTNAFIQASPVTSGQPFTWCESSGRELRRRSPGDCGNPVAADSLKAGVAHWPCFLSLEGAL